METITHALRRCAEWGIAWRSKFQNDPFTRAALYIIGLQALLVALLIGTFVLALKVAEDDVIATIATRAPALFTLPTGQAARSIAELMITAQAQSMRVVLAAVVLLGAIFGVLLSYVTSRPARNTLHYQKLFISNVAHELRTPLSIIKTSTEVSLLDPTLSPSLRKMLLDTVSELDRVSEIINNLLSLNRLLRPEQMEFHNVDLGPIIDGVVDRLSRLAAERNIEIVVKKHDYRTVWGNATALEQVITNLLKNAISYTPKGRHGVVSVSISPNYRGSVVFSVSDNGVGIAQHDLFHIFEPFYRADLSRTRNVKKSGSGLGLAIVNEIVRVHRGKIHIQSAVSKGTTVSIIFPAGATPSGELQLQAEKPALSEVSIDFSKGR